MSNKTKFSIIEQSNDLKTRALCQGSVSAYGHIKSSALIFVTSEEIDEYLLKEYPNDSSGEFYARKSVIYENIIGELLEAICKTQHTLRS